MNHHRGESVCIAGKQGPVSINGYSIYHPSLNELSSVTSAAAQLLLACEHLGEN